jgi:glycosyltransferase involved in cell wall biosynthesis
MLSLYLGRLKAYKSIHIFIKAAQEVLKRIPHTEFIIAGDGEEKSNLMRLTKKIGIETSINFVGKVTEEEKIRLYQRAWLFVHPSMMEGWSLGIIEANACGTPVVASNVSGLRDSVRNPTTGFLVPYGDEKAFAEKMIQLIRDEKLRSDFSRGAIEWASNFSWDKSAMTCLELFT